MNIEKDLKHFNNDMLKEELQTINILKSIINNNIQNFVVKNELKKVLCNYKSIINKKLCKEENSRTCSECGKEMIQGYCIENGMEYYCSDECLHKYYTEKEFEELYDDGNGDSYWTEWEEEE